MLRRLLSSAPVALLLAAGLTTAAHAGEDPIGNDPNCRGQWLAVTTCAQDPGTPSASGGSNHQASSAAETGGSSTPPPCTYTKLVPQPPADNLGWDGHKPGDKGAVYQVYCPDTMRIGVSWIPDGGPAAPPVDPEVLAHRAVDSMKLVGPDIASPQAAGTYAVGVPMWLWVNQSPTTFGPNTATASAGAVTVSATAKVASITWKFGDGTSVTCNGPGTVYQASSGMKPSPTCGHTFAKSSAGQSGQKFALTATSTWQVDWTVTAGAVDAGQFTEVRQSQSQVGVGELQAVGN
ncbi:ATP/GTP-binding protein [Streptomyces mauvecolor]|uniref:ATP/GTP-binding protein n=1 Tax=Streptomyces mauvecolor TaxID=58345 RepID=A0ABV9UF26_9ACTN